MVRMMVAAVLLAACAAAGGEAPKIEEGKPRVAFFPLGGNAKEELRDRTGFSLRMKLDRTGVYDVVDGPRMAELAAELGEPVTASTPVERLKELGALVRADVLVWGEMSNTPQGATVRLKILDLREGATARPRELVKVVKEPTDLRFVSEQILETLPGVAKFEHPSEEGVTNDAVAEKMWREQPNLVKNGDFSSAGSWKGIYMSEYYDVPISDRLPPVDKVVIYRMPDGKGGTNNVLAMNLSKYCAENNGLACLSDAIEIAPDTRYRLSFRYRSDGPTLHVFVKGYTMFENIKGEKTMREIYRRQVPPSGKTDGQWVTIVDDLNPQHVVFPVQFLKVDLYAYLSPGIVMFDDIILKPVGKQTRKAKDEAIDKPVARPGGAR